MIGIMASRRAPEPKDWKTEVEKLFDDFRKRAGGDAAAGAILVMACKIGGIEHQLNQILELLKTCQHGRYLASLGFENDLSFCAKIDSHPVLPTFMDGVIRGTHPDGTSPVETTQVTA